MSFLPSSSASPSVLSLPASSTSPGLSSLDLADARYRLRGLGSRCGSILRLALHLWTAMVLLLSVTACQSKLDEPSFRRRAEKVYASANPGWTVLKRDPKQTIFVRGDQLDTLDVSALFQRYQGKGESASAFFDAWETELSNIVKARRRTLAQAEGDVVAMLKGGDWMRIQDLGSIGVDQDKVRPWRNTVASDVFVVLGIPEEKLGYRLPSIDEVKSSSKPEEKWIDIAIENVNRKLETLGAGSDIRGAQDRLLVYELPKTDGVSALVLSETFRSKMLEKFARDHLAAAAPLKDVLIIFDPEELAALKPVRARTHELYDTKNHYGFRGLLRFDVKTVTILEPANPEAKKTAP